MFFNVNLIHTTNGAPYKRELTVSLYGKDRADHMEQVAFILTGLEIDLDEIVKLDVVPIEGAELIRLEPAMVIVPYA